MKRKSLVGLVFAAFCAVTPVLGSQNCGHKAEIESPTLPDGAQTVTFCKVDGQELMDGDIILPPKTLDTSSEGTDYAGVVTRKSSLWPNGRVAFKVSASLGNTKRIYDAIAHWQSRTPIRFVPRTNETDYLNFVPGGGCSSSVGRVGGAQSVVLASGCDTGAVIHELGHAMGLWHEQSRNDRDDHVQIMWQNISTSHRFNFNKFEGGGTNFGRYDYASIMHYEPYAFSKNGAPTIVPRGGGQIPNWSRNHLSDGDVAAIQYLY